MKLPKVRKRIIAGWPLIAIFLVVVVFFWKFVFRGLLPIPADTIVGMYHPWRDVVWDGLTAGVPFKNFLITDPVRQQFPWRQLIINSFQNRQIPKWDPYSMAGMPLLANIQSAPFYIFNCLFFPPIGGQVFFDFGTAWGILILLQPLLAGLFTYFYLQQLKLTKPACLMGALSFAFGGFFVAWLEWGTVLHSALWLPLILLAVDRLVSYKLRVTSLILWSLTFTFALTQSFFAGHLQVFFYVFLFSGVYLLWRFWQIKTDRKKVFLLFFILYTFFFILSSIQWRPTMELIRLSARQVDQADWNKPGWFIPWQHLVQFFAPDFFGNPTTLNYWGEWNYAEFIGFIGVVPLVLAGWALFKRRTRFFSIACLLALSFALPTPWAKLIYRWQIPFLSTSQPTRLLFLAGFCLAVLAAMGLDNFLKKDKKLKSLVPFLAIYGCLWLFVLLAKGENLAISKRNLILPTGMLIAFAGLVVAFGLADKLFKKNKRVSCIAYYISLSTLMALTVFDLLRFGWKFTPFVKRGWLFPMTETIEFLKQDQSAFRIMAVDRRIMPPNFAGVYGLQDVAGYNPLYLQRYGELVAAMERDEPNIEPPFGFNRIITPHRWQSRIADLLNVKYVLSLTNLDSDKLDLVFQEGETRVYENKSVFSRAFMVYDYQVASDKQGVINLLMDNHSYLTTFNDTYDWGNWVNSSTATVGDTDSPTFKGNSTNVGSVVVNTAIDLFVNSQDEISLTPST